MACTKIHAIKTTLDKAIDYICDPQKTDESIFISAYACAPQTAAIDFKYTLDHCRENSPNLAYHLIQAFSPGEVDCEEAHRIGQELADKVLEGKYSYVLTTHIDKGHIHNHIIFCAADNINHDKYNDCKRTYYRIRKISDQLCKEHNLSVIIPGEQSGKKHNEWNAEKNGASWKTQLRKDINTAIKFSSTYEEFLTLMRAKGYEIKGEEFGEDTAKYISFRPLENVRFVRGSARSLGKEYTKERIKERIETAQEHNHRYTKKDYISRRLIDTSQEKFRTSPGLLRWATIENLKIASQNYLAAGSISELEHQLVLKTETATSARQNVVKLEKRIKELSEIIKYAEQYRDTRKCYLGYKKSKNPDGYLRKYESQLILHDGAKYILEQVGIDLKSLNLKRLKTKYQTLTEQKNSLMDSYKSADREVQELNQKLETLREYLDFETEAPQHQPTAKTPFL